MSTVPMAILQSPIILLSPLIQPRLLIQAATLMMTAQVTCGVTLQSIQENANLAVELMLTAQR